MENMAIAHGTVAAVSFRPDTLRVYASFLPEFLFFLRNRVMSVFANSFVVITVIIHRSQLTLERYNCNLQGMIYLKISILKQEEQQNIIV